MAMTNAEKQANYRERFKDALAERIDDLWNDVLITEERKDGKQIVTFNAPQEVWDDLETVAKAQGTSMDALIRAAIDKNVRQAARWQELKARKEGQGKIGLEATGPELGLT